MEYFGIKTWSFLETLVEQIVKETCLLVWCLGFLLC